ncbi:hypothetical protein HDZ31DRAFT_38258 [Schizophyllum fasciatum]
MDPCWRLPPDDAARAVLERYLSTGYRPFIPSQFTILASFFLFRSPLSPLATSSKIISLGTGTKCLPTCQLPLHGEALHDSHAEIVARRGAIRWFLEEITRVSRPDSYSSEWLLQHTDGNYDLQEGVHVGMYISTVPCGDASTRFLAAAPQDADMAALKESGPRPITDPRSAARGRDNYALTGVLRTKPGRADAPPTMSMSCSDKIAAWSVLGFQGALGSLVLRPLFLEHIVLGGVPDDIRDVVLEDCERALWPRAGSSPHRPVISLTSLEFIHSRSALSSMGYDCKASSNESLSWIADSDAPHEILVNGTRRGVPPKHQLRHKSIPRISQLALYRLFAPLHDVPHNATYYGVKQSAQEYRTTKDVLIGPEGAFEGWHRSQPTWQNFDVDGKVPAETSDGEPSDVRQKKHSPV